MERILHFLKANYNLKLRKRSDGSHFSLIDFRTILCTSFAMLCIMELADPCGCVPRLIRSLVSDRIHPVGDTGKRSGREEGGSQAIPPLSLLQAMCPASLSPWAPASTGQPTLLLAQLLKAVPCCGSQS